MSRMKKAVGTDFVPDADYAYATRKYEPDIRIYQPKRPGRNREKPARQIMLYITVAVVVVGLYVQVSRLAQIYGQTRVITRLNSEIHDLESAYSNLNVEYQQLANEQRVIDISQNTLKMSAPAPEQRKTVSVSLHADAAGEQAQTASSETP